MLGILVAGEADEAHLALLASPAASASAAPSGREDQVRIVVVDHFVDLPHVEMIGLQAAQRLLQLLHGHIFAAAVRADLGHQDGAVALALQRLAQPLLALAVVVIPGVVEEVDAGVDGLVRRSRCASCWFLAEPR